MVLVGAHIFGIQRNLEVQAMTWYRVIGPEIDVDPLAFEVSILVDLKGAFVSFGIVAGPTMWVV